MSNALEELRRTVQGGRVIAEWLGENGQPVLRSLAEARAFICTHGNRGKPCSENREPNWWGRVKSKIANAIKDQLSVKNSCSITVTEEPSLHMCAKCGCALPLKVHVPIGHILHHTAKSEIPEYPDFCWIKKELL